MVGFSFPVIHREWPAKLSSSQWLWIWNADKIPPHIGISVGKDYFSLTYKEVERKQTTSMVAKAKRSQIPLLLVRLTQNLTSEAVQAEFSNYKKAEVGGPTCLFPIRELVGAQESVQQLAQLLDFLSTQQGELEVFGVHLKQDFRGLTPYSVDQIMKRINELHAAKQ